MRTQAAHTVARLLPLFLILLMLAACTAAPSTITSSGVPASAATPTTAVAQSSTPAAQPTTGAGAGAPAASPGGAAAATPTADVTAAVKTVIQRANAEQQQAFAAQDPTLMRDTATAAYYNELVQTNQDLAANGVAAIALLGLDWGPITPQGPSTVQATTFETWRTTYSDGSTEQGREQNVYTVVLDGGTWKVQADAHPGTADQSTSGSSGSAGTPPPTTLPTTPANPDQSLNWAGYNASGGTFTAVASTWTVPQVAAGSGSGADATWVGIGGVTARDLIQAGTDATVVGSHVRYTAWVELLPQAAEQVPLVVNPGDQVSVAITQQAGGTWLIAFQNRTTGQAYQVTENYTSSRSSAEWVEEAPAAGRRVVALDDFGTVQFQGASAVKDGQHMTIAQAGGTAITLIDRTGQVLASPSALGSDGASFSVQRTAVTPASPAPTTPGRGRPASGTPAAP